MITVDCQCFYDPAEKEMRAHIGTNGLVLERLSGHNKCEAFFRLVLGTILIKLNEMEDGSAEVLYIGFYCRRGERRSVACADITDSDWGAWPSQSITCAPMSGVGGAIATGSAPIAYGHRPTSRCRGSAACGRRGPCGWATSSMTYREPHSDGLNSATRVWG